MVVVTLPFEKTNSTIYSNRHRYPTTPEESFLMRRSHVFSFIASPVFLSRDLELHSKFSCLPLTMGNRKQIQFNVTRKTKLYELHTSAKEKSGKSFSFSLVRHFLFQSLHSSVLPFCQDFSISIHSSLSFYSYNLIQPSLGKAGNRTALHSSSVISFEVSTSPNQSIGCQSYTI